jgi:hypothetical protein
MLHTPAAAREALLTAKPDFPDAEHIAAEMLFLARTLAGHDGLRSARPLGLGLRNRTTSDIPTPSAPDRTVAPGTLSGNPVGQARLQDHGLALALPWVFYSTYD